ncbi:hypothetical protein, conserved [Plasmodium gonderi]|uniref:CS domain-containing protein n=1 Tax=Plasmodium gonderi TaxID=77519 RepID=A0A1Y1JRQ8_PLAGO|nr:hypothetical protein, conserved [Plasmodium gonderi]GAW82694.1 hypothetical protein, conserved [Plasmodium gonderi]
MELSWRENFDSIEIKLKKENSEESVFSDLRYIENYCWENEQVIEMEKTKDILVTEMYIKINHKDEMMNIDLYDKINVNKEHVKIRQNTKFIIFNLKKKEKKLWGHLNYFTIFLIYKNVAYPNLIKCTKEEKNKLIAQEKKFKSVINDRRIKSINDLKKILRKDKNSKEDFIKKLQEDAQNIQCQLEELRNEQLKNQKEEIRKRAIHSIYENSQESEMDKPELHNKVDRMNSSYVNIDNHNDKNLSAEKNSNKINTYIDELTDGQRESSNPMNISSSNLTMTSKPKVLLLQDQKNVQKKVIELKFTQMKRNELPARESRNVKQKIPNFTSTKNFFLIILIEKAKKLYFKNADFGSCLETLKSVDSYLVNGSELVKEEQIKMLNNLSLLYLLTNELSECINTCDRCLNMIKEEIKSYNVEDTHFEKNILTDVNNVQMKTWNILDNIKSQNYVQYIYTIYAIVSARKICAMIKQTRENLLENIDKIYISIEDISRYLPCSIYEDLKKGINNFKLFSTFISHLNKFNLNHISYVDQARQNLQILNKNILEEKNTYNISFSFCITMMRSLNLKNLNRFYQNVINILLCIFTLIERQNEIYSFLNNVENSTSSNSALVHIYLFILLIKNESSYYDKIEEIVNLRNHTYEYPNIRNKVMNILICHLMGGFYELDLIVRNNLCLKNIISSILHKDEIAVVTEPLEHGCARNIEPKSEMAHVGDKIIVYQTNERFFSPSKTLFENISCKIKKEEKVAKHISSVNTQSYALKVELFESLTEYLCVKQKCEYFKIEIVIKMIKNICYTFNLIQRIYKENEKNKMHLKRAMYTLLTDLSYSISKLNSSSVETENVISLLFLYFCFSFIYNYPKNEFIIDTHYKTMDEMTHSNYFALNDDTQEEKKFSKDNLKSILQKTFLYKFFLDYKQYEDLKKKKTYIDSAGRASQQDLEHNSMLQRISSLIKKIKTKIKNNTNKKIHNYYPIMKLINKKYVKELHHFVSFLKKKDLHLESIRCNILLLSSHYYSPSLSNFSFSYVNAVHNIFTSTFFEKNEINKQKKITLDNNLSTESKRILHKNISYFTNSTFINFKNTKRAIFLKSFQEENMKNALVTYIRSIICKLKRVQILRNIFTSLQHIHAHGEILKNILKVLMNYLNNLSVDFHILNLVINFITQVDISPLFLVNKKKIENLYDFNDTSISEKWKELFSNNEEYKYILQHHFKKFLKIKIFLLSHECVLYV